MSAAEPDDGGAASRRPAKRSPAWGLALLGAVLVGILILWPYRDKIGLIEPWVQQHEGLGAVIYVLAGMVSVVMLPLSSLPLLPLAVSIWGVWMAGALSAAGWWLGALVAFWIARVARSSLERFVSLAALDKVERSIPPDMGFVGIVVLRMLLPVDLTSFALGLLRDLRFTTYAVASLIGILPFAFVWAYAGGKLASGQYLVFAAMAAALLGLGLVAKRYWSRRRKQSGAASSQPPARAGHHPAEGPARSTAPPSATQSANPPKL